MEKLKQIKLILLLSYISLASVAAAVITPALPTIQQAFRLSNDSLEWVISIFLVSYALGQLIYGPLANTLGRIQALKIGIGIYIIGIIICLFYSYQMNYSGILVGRFITGLGSASGLACTFILLNETLPKKQAKTAFSYTLISFTLGIGIAIAIGGIVTEHGHWQNCFFALLVHATILLYLIKYLPAEKIKHENQPIKKSILSLKHACTSKRLIIFSLTVGFSSMFTYGYNFAAPLYSQLSLKMTSSGFGYWNSINTAGMLLSVIIGSRATPKLGCYNTCKLGLIGMLISLTMFCLALQHKQFDPSSFFLMSGLCNFSSGLLYASASYMATNAIADKGASASIMSFINMFCATMCVCILGSTSFTPMIIFIAIMLAVCLVLVSLFVIGQRHLDKECNHNLKPVAHK